MVNYVQWPSMHFIHMHGQLQSHKYMLHSALEALRNALYKCSTYLLTYLLTDIYCAQNLPLEKFEAHALWQL